MNFSPLMAELQDACSLAEKRGFQCLAQRCFEHAEKRWTIVPALKAWALPSLKRKEERNLIHLLLAIMYFFIKLVHKTIKEVTKQ